MENAKPLQDVAKTFGVTDNQLRYWLKLLEEKPVREGKLRFLSPETESRIQEMTGLIRQGTPPKEAAAKVKGSPVSVALVPHEKNDSLEEIRKVLMLLVDENRQMKEHMISMGKEVSTVRHENAALRGLLEAPRRSAPPVSPPVRKDPPRELSLWESVQLSFNDCMGFLFGRG